MVGSGVDDAMEEGEEDDQPTMLYEDESLSKPTTTPQPKKSRPKSRPRPTPHRTPASSRKIRPSQRALARPSNKSPSASQQRVTFRLRIGSSRNAKGGSDEEKKSQFETFLAPEEYDTSKSVVAFDDKGRFEKSRIAAEVRTATYVHPL